MVAHRASMGRSQQEHLAQQVAQRSAMPSTNNQVAYLRAQLALRDAQIEQVKAERDNHFVQEEEGLAHMRLLSSEGEDSIWKSRVVTEAEEVLCRESAQMAQQATEAHEAMDQHYKAKWQQAEADLTALCQSNSAQVQSFACKIDQTVPSRTVESEPENTLNTLSPGRSTRWILPQELETPNRPTSSGMQSPRGAPVQLGPRPQARIECTPSRQCSISTMGRRLWSSSR